jgi:aryl-alcohol dehydrogenase-like predicted oxidoreductase
MLNGLGAIATELDCTQAQLALAWTLKNKDVSTAIFGASSLNQAESNLGAMEVVERLTPEVLERIEGLLNNRPAPGMDWMKFTPLPPRR